MRQSVRKKMSVTKLTMARVKYIREHFFQFVTSQIARRQDILVSENMHSDTMVFEVGVEVLFKAICNALELSPEETDIKAVEEYSVSRDLPEEFVEKLSSFVELCHETEKRSNVTLEDRKKAIEELRAKRSQEISDEWDE